MGERMSLVAWTLAIAVSVAALVASAASRVGNVSMGYAHMAIAAGVSIFFALYAIRNMQAHARAGAAPAAIAAESARSQGLVWTWGAIVIAVTYGTGVMYWKEWIAHFSGMFVVGAICLAVAAFLGKSVEHGTDDPVMINVARVLTIGQLVAMILVIAGFLIDGQLKRFQVERYTDWPAKHVIFFGAIAIAAICGATLGLVPRTTEKRT